MSDKGELNLEIQGLQARIAQCETTMFALYNGLSLLTNTLANLAGAYGIIINAAMVTYCIPYMTIGSTSTFQALLDLYSGYFSSFQITNLTNAMQGALTNKVNSALSSVTTALTTAQNTAKTNLTNYITTFGGDGLTSIYLTASVRELSDSQLQLTASQNDLQWAQEVGMPQADIDAINAQITVYSATVTTNTNAFNSQCASLLTIPDIPPGTRATECANILGYANKVVDTQNGSSLVNSLFAAQADATIGQIKSSVENKLSMYNP